MKPRPDAPDAARKALRPTAHPQPLPREPLARAMRAFRESRLDALRHAVPPPCRHAGVTLLIYAFPSSPSPAAWEPFEFALRQSRAVLGHLPAVVVVPQGAALPAPWASLPDLEVQEEPTLRPGDIASMSDDCLLRLYRRFSTRHVLIVQADGWPMHDALEDFLRFDYVGAPSVSPGWRSRVADALGLTVLNGGFSLRSRRLCHTMARLARLLPRRPDTPEDRLYSRLRWLRPWLRFPSAAVARRFSEDALDGRLPPAPESSPMGFHRDSTFRALYAHEPPLTVVSVVRDWACYRRCLAENPHLRGARFLPCDNTRENRPIPERYNAAIAALPPETSGWVLFAHEDFAPQEDPRPLLARRNPLFPCSLIGSRLVGGLAVLPFGRLSDSARDGSRPHLNRPPLPYGTLLGNYTENTDCCALFVHVEALRAWKLRFDPRCAWDLYVEDLCFSYLIASGHGLPVLPLRAHHYSRGNARTQRFTETLAYLNRKYADYCFAGGTCALLIGSPSRAIRWVNGLLGVANLLLFGVPRALTAWMKGEGKAPKAP